MRALERPVLAVDQPVHSPPWIPGQARVELKGLHGGNIARYRLRLSEFRDWQAKQR